MESLERVMEAFEFFEDWEDKYHYLAELGQRLPVLPEEYRTPDHQVAGCVSQVWILAEVDNSQGPVVNLRADSDTPIIKGIAAILLAIYSGKRSDEIKGIDADGIFAKLGIDDHLSPSRHVGVYAMTEKIHALAGTPASLAA